MILLGWRVWPAVFLGALFVNLTTASTGFSSLGIAIGNTLEALAGYFLVEKLAGGKLVFDKPQNTVRYVILAAILAPLISATVGTVSLYAGGQTGMADPGAIWLTW